MKAYCEKIRDEHEEEYYQLGRKAGIREVVEFVEKSIPKTLANYVGFWLNWQAKLKEWGL